MPLIFYFYFDLAIVMVSGIFVHYKGKMTSIKQNDYRNHLARASRWIAPGGYLYHSPHHFHINLESVKSPAWEEKTMSLSRLRRA